MSTKINILSLFLTAFISHNLLYSCAPAPLPKPQTRPSFQWPAYREAYPAIPYLNSTFGESRLERFHNGLDLAGVSEPVYPLAAGRVLYTYYAQDDPYAPERGPGNSIILDHGQGLWSGYYHLLAGPQSLRRTKVSTEDIIARIGNTGRSSGSHLHFFLAAEHGKRLINPLRYLPPIEDPHPPRIGALVVGVSAESTTRIVHTKPALIRLTRRHPVYLELEDEGSEKNSRRGIYELDWQLNEKKSRHFRFDELRYHQSRWHLGLAGFDQVFNQRLYSLGRLNFRQGLNEIKVRARDYKGNTSQEVFQIKVARQY